MRSPQDVEACEAQQSLPWCAPAAGAGDVGRAWTLREVDMFQRRIEQRFTYSHFVTQPWRSLYDDISDGRAWRGDCNEMVFTVLDGLARAGFPKDKMWRAVVEGESNGVNHMVAVVEVDDKFYVIGDTSHRDARLWRRAKYRPILVSNVAVGAGWRRVSR